MRTLKRLCLFIFKKIWVCLSFLTKWNVYFAYCHSFDRMCTVCIYLWPYSYSNVPLFYVPYHIWWIIDIKTVVIQRLVWELLGIDIGAGSCRRYDLYFFSCCISNHRVLWGKLLNLEKKYCPFNITIAVFNMHYLVPWIWISHKFPCITSTFNISFKGKQVKSK